MNQPTLMEQEARQAPDIIAKQLEANQGLIADLCQRLQTVDVPFIVTVARGSSDHAANFAKYVFETQLNLVTSSAAPSVTTLYKSKLKLKNSLVIGISQSGQSPDICEVMAMARQQVAITVAMVNQVDSPLANIAEYTLPLSAGKESAVAATKSYLATLAMIIHFVAGYKQDSTLKDALKRLPDSLAQALNCSWSAAFPIFETAHNCLVVARGYGFPVALEAALKFKETCAIQAEAFSSAEVMHGPLALVRSNYPILLFTQQDATLPGLLEAANKLTQLGGHTLLALPQNLIHEQRCEILLPLPPSIHPILDPLLAIQAFYPMVSQLAVLRGLNPDQPQHLQKVTKTL